MKCERKRKKEWKRERENCMDIASRIDRFLVKSYSRCCGRWWIIFRIRPVPSSESFVPFFWLSNDPSQPLFYRALSLCTHGRNSSASLSRTFCSIRPFFDIFLYFFTSAKRVIGPPEDRNRYSSPEMDIKNDRNVITRDELRTFLALYTKSQINQLYTI